MRAEALSRKPGHVGAIAFSRSGEPATGDIGDATPIQKFGDVERACDEAVDPPFGSATFTPPHGGVAAAAP